MYADFRCIQSLSFVTTWHLRSTAACRGHKIVWESFVTSSAYPKKRRKRKELSSDDDG